MMKHPVIASTIVAIGFLLAGCASQQAPEDHQPSPWLSTGKPVTMSTNALPGAPMEAFKRDHPGGHISAVDHARVNGNLGYIITYIDADGASGVVTYDEAGNEL